MTHQMPNNSFILLLYYMLLYYIWHLDLIFAFANLILKFKFFLILRVVLGSLSDIRFSTVQPRPDKNDRVSCPVYTTVLGQVTFYNTHGHV